MTTFIKSFFSVLFCAMMAVSLSAQTNYVFTGAGSWTDAAKWSPSYPGTTVAAGNTITINNARVEIPSGVTVMVSCDVTNDGGMRIIGTGEYHQLAGTYTLNSGKLWQGPINNIAAGATFVNNSEVRLWNNGTTNLNGTIVNNGSISADQFTSAGNNVISNIGGDLSGTGGYNGHNSGGNSTFSGTLNPGANGGADAGCPFYAFSNHTASAVTNLIVDGTSACTQYDKISGINTLDYAPGGTLNVTVNYTPTDGDVITLIDGTNSTLSTTYATENVPAGWSVAYNSPTGDVTMTYDASAVAAVPTMGEWALIILALIIMSMGVVTVMRWQNVRDLQTAGGNAQVSMNTGNSLPFNKKSYFQILPLVWVSLAIVFAVSVIGFGYEMTGADIPGALMAGGVGAYLIHLIRKA